MFDMFRVFEISFDLALKSIFHFCVIGELDLVE